jgi:DNA repair exonuclease SbcCD nuclease subunit
MRIAHISDLHLGRASAGDPHGAARLLSFRHAVAKLAACNPDVLVIAGDTFDTPDVEPATIEQAAQVLKLARNDRGERIPVVVIPGNHDPVEAIGLWNTFLKFVETPPTSLVLEASLVPLHDGKLLIEAYPCPTRFSPGPPWEKRLSLSALSTSAVRVVVAHGTLQGGPVPEGEMEAYPFTQADVESLGADYVALGHFHVTYPAWLGGEESERSFGYCGTHESLHQFDSDDGYALLAEIARGQPTRVRRLKVGRRQRRLLEIASPADLARLEQLRTEITEAADPQQFVVRLQVGGNGWPVEKIERLAHLQKSLETLGAHVDRCGDVRPRLDAQSLDLSALPSGAVKEALQSLRADLASAKEDRQREVLEATLQLGWEALQDATPA